MEVAEDIEYSGIRMQNWVLSNFGYQYILWPFRSLVAVPRLEFKASQVFVFEAMLFGSPVGGRLDFSDRQKGDEVGPVGGGWWVEFQLPRHAS